MKKLVAYAKKAPFMEIAVAIDKKVYKFNLDSELVISESNLASELKTQPRAWAFLGMLKSKLSVKLKEDEKALKRYKDKLFLKFKETTEKVTEASARAAADPKVQAMEDALAKVQQLKDILDIALEAFQQRRSMLQTLSANERDYNKG